jgi:hypothetical protein
MAAVLTIRQQTRAGPVAGQMSCGKDARRWRFACESYAIFPETLEISMPTIKELETELHHLRALSGFYGRRRDYAMQDLYAEKAYRLFVEIERRRE